MWEGILEKLLTKYLSEYVEGIEREKLQVGILSGDIELCDLLIKPKAFDGLNLGVSVLYGRIKRLSIGISWKKWMSQDYDLSIKVEQVYLLLKPHIPTDPVSLETLRKDLRERKERAILRRESRFLEAMRLKTHESANTKNSTFLMNLTNRLLRNMEIEFRDVHVAFHDPVRSFTLGCMLDVGSFLSADPLEVLASLFYDGVLWDSNDRDWDPIKQISKCVELKGFSIYVSLNTIREWNQLVAAFTKKETQCLDTLVQQLLFKIKASLKDSGASRFAHAYTKSTGEPCPRVQRLDKVKQCTASLEWREDTGAMDKGDCSDRFAVSCNYILLPLHVSFYFSSSSVKHHVVASLQIREESQGISIDRCHLKAFIDLLHEASEYKRYCKRALIGKNNPINVDHHDLDEDTRKLFFSLYGRKLRYEAGLGGHTTCLTWAETDTLTFLHDVVGVRRLARWRAICLIEVEKLLQAKQTLVEEEIIRARKEQSWWGWVTQGSGNLEYSVLERLKQQDHTILTDDEAKFVSQAVTTELSSESPDGSSVYELFFKLPNFYVSIYGNDTGGVGGAEEPPHHKDTHATERFLELCLNNLQVKMSINSSVDQQDKDVYWWQFNFMLSNLMVWHYGQAFILLKSMGEVDALKDAEGGGVGASGEKRGLQSPWLSTHQAYGQPPQTTSNDKDAYSILPNAVRSDHAEDTRYTQQDTRTVKGVATIWDVQRRVEGTKGEYRVFIQMAPLKVLVTQKLVVDILSLWSFICTSDKTSEFNADAVSYEDHEEGMFFDGMMDNYERFRMVAHENRTNVLNVYMLLFAPIVYYEASKASGVVVQLGKLCVTTSKRCTLSDVAFHVELSDTQASCWSTLQRHLIPILRPVSIELCLCYASNTSRASLDLMFHELFIEMYADTLDILLRMLADVVTCVAHNHNAAWEGHTPPRQSVCPPQPVEGSLCETSTTCTLDMTTARTSSVHTPPSPADDAFPVPFADDMELNAFQLFSWTTVVFVRRVGFSVFDAKATEILRAGAVDASLTLVGETFQGSSAQLHGTLLLESIFVSDPSTTTLLFLTLMHDAVRVDENELFGEPEKETARPSMPIDNPFELPFELPFVTNVAHTRPSACDHIPRTDINDVVNDDRTGQFWDTCDNQRDDRTGQFWDTCDNQRDDRTGQFWDTCDNQRDNQRDVDQHKVGPAGRLAAKMKASGVESFVVTYTSFPFTQLRFQINASCELHWQKNSINKVLQTVQESRNAMNACVEEQIQWLQEQKLCMVGVTHPYSEAMSQGLTELENTLMWMRTVLCGTGEAEEERVVEDATHSKDTEHQEHATVQSMENLKPDVDLPALCGEAMNHQVVHCCRVECRTACFSFWKDNEKLGESRLSDIQFHFTGFSSSDAELKISVTHVELSLEGQPMLGSMDLFEKVKRSCCTACDTTPGSAPTTTSHDPTPVLTCDIRFYRSAHTATKKKFPFRACVCCHLSHLTFIYVHKAITQMYAYLCDGILDVILRKSYEVAYHFATSSYVLCGFVAHKVVILIPEDKARIPQLSLYWNTHHTHRNVSTPHMGSFIAFCVTKVAFRNGYALALDSPQPSHATPLPHAPVQRTRITSKMVIELYGLSASMVHSTAYPWFSKDVEGQVLQRVEGTGVLHAGDPFLVDLNLSHMELSLNREQLTLLLDILNENFAGLSYNPAAIKLHGANLLESRSDIQWLGTLNGLEETRSDLVEMELEDHLSELFSMTPLRVSIRVSIARIQFNAAFLPKDPLLQLDTRNISIACDVSLFSLYITYRFSFLADYLVVEDMRTLSKNVYKRFLECLPPTTFISTLKRHVHVQNALPSTPSAYTYYYGDELPGTEPIWMRPIIEPHAATGTRIPGATPSSYDTRAPLDAKSVSLSFISNVTTTRFAAELWRPTLHLFTVGMTDVLDFVIAAFSHSTMRRCPKPVPTVITTYTRQDSDAQTVRARLEKRLQTMIVQVRPFLIDVTIHQGVFNLFSDITSLYEPIIEVKGDFEFKAESFAHYLLFKSISLHNCVMSRVNIAPLPASMQKRSMSAPSLDPQDVQKHCTMSTLSLARTSLFKPTSSIVITKTFSFKAHGILETVYDAVLQRWCSSVSAHLNNNTQHFPDEQDIFPELDPPTNTGRPYVQMSLLTIDIEIPACVLYCSLRDIAIMSSALGNLNTDLPTLSPKSPYPPILAVNSSYASDTQIPLLSTVSEHACIPSETMPSEPNIINIDRYSRLHLTCGNIRFVVLDDRRITSIPIFDCCVTVQSIKLSRNPDILLMTINRFTLHANYMSPSAGEWQPFIEEFHVSLSYTVTYNRNDNQALIGSSIPSSTPQQSWLYYSSDSETTIDQRKQRTKTHVVPGSSLTPEESYQLSQEWSGFFPTSCVIIFSQSPLLINITPHLCQLFTWVFSSFSALFNAKSLEHSDVVGHSTTNDTSATAGVRPTSTPSPNDQNPTAIQSISETLYSYVNLTGERFIAFSILPSKHDHEQKMDCGAQLHNTLDTVDHLARAHTKLSQRPPKHPVTENDNPCGVQLESLIYLEPTTIPKSMDALAISYSTFQLAHPKVATKSLTMFICRDVPNDVLHVLKDMFPGIPTKEIKRHLLATRNAKETRNYFLNCCHHDDMRQPHKGNATRMPLQQSSSTPAYLGDFPRHMEIVPIPLCRTGTHSVPMQFGVLAPQKNASDTDRNINTHTSPPNRTIYDDETLCRTPTQAVAQVLSPHPSYKLLLITSCTVLENHTGFPLQIAFLRDAQQPFLISNPHSYVSPCSLLRGGLSQDISDASFSDVSETTFHCRRHLEYPHLRDRVSIEAINAHNAQTTCYSICVPDHCFVSPPPDCFLNTNRLLCSFRPAYLDPNLTRNACTLTKISTCTSPHITVADGWCALLDVDCEEYSAYALKPYIRSCRIPLDIHADPLAHRNTLKSMDFNEIAMLKRTSAELHLTVQRVEKEKVFPRDTSLFSLKIFPPFTIINACPTPLYVRLASTEKTSFPRSSSNAIHPEADTLSHMTITQSALRAPPDLTLLIMPFTMFTIFSVSPLANKTCLCMRLCFAPVPEAQWSRSVTLLNAHHAKDDVVSRVLLDCGHLSSIEIEIYKQPYQSIGAVPLLSRHQNACILSSSRWLIDRTGLGLSFLNPAAPNKTVFPIVDKICLLGNSDHPEVQIMYTPQPLCATPMALCSKQGVSSRKMTSCFVEIPSVGGFSTALLKTESSVCILCVQTAQVNPTEIYGAAAQCITVTPKYLFTNTLNDTVSLRQMFHECHFENLNPITTCASNASVPLYWTESRQVLLFQFKVGDVHEWSGCVCPTDDFVGGYDIAVLNVKRSHYSIFHVQIIAEHDPLRIPLFSSILHNHIKGVQVVLQTYHSKPTARKHGATALSKCDAVASFRAAYDERVWIAWPSPFTLQEFICEITLLDTHERLLRHPGVFNLDLRHSCQRRCLEIKNTQFPTRCFIAIRSQANVVTIDIITESSCVVRHVPAVLPKHVKGSPPNALGPTFVNPSQSRRFPLHLVSEDRINITSTSDPATVPLFQVVVYLSQIGLCCVSNTMREEVLYMEVSTVCACLLQKNDNQLVEFCVQSVQIDSQLEQSEKPVLLAMHTGGPSYEIPLDSPRDLSPYSAIVRVLRYSGPYVVLQPFIKGGFHADNHQKRNTHVTHGTLPLETKSFIHTFVEREAISSCDLYLRNVHIFLGDLELDIDAEMLNGLETFSRECLEAFGLNQSYGVPISTVFQWGLKPIYDGFQPSKLGKTVTLKQMRIFKFSVIVWCSLLLHKVHFLSDFLKMALRILMVSPTLELTAAPITFDSEIVHNTIRGSLLTLLTVMKARYLQQIVSSLGVVLGYSSLANIPRTPLDLFRGTVGLGLTVADNVTSGLGSVLSNLTFDSDYIARREMANSQAPRTVKDGLASASRDLKEGFVSLGEVVTKTIGGAQRGGISGLFRGLGKGVAGSILKPVDKLGQAISDVASGIRAEYVVGHQEKKSCVHRRRKPRMLSGPGGLIRKYDAHEAELRSCLTLNDAKYIIGSIVINRRETPVPSQSLVVVYPTKLNFVNLLQNTDIKAHSSTVDTQALVPLVSLDTFVKSKAGSSKRDVARILWSVNFRDLQSVRASSHGVIIQTKEKVYQILCDNAVTIRRLYEEIVKYQQRIKATLIVENIAEWIGGANYTQCNT